MRFQHGLPNRTGWITDRPRTVDIRIVTTGAGPGVL